MEKWLKETAPTHESRGGSRHGRSKWNEFRRRAAAALDERPDLVAELLALARAGDLTPVDGSKERRLNDASALEAYPEERL